MPGGIAFGLLTRVELEISPEQAGLSPEQVRTLVRVVMKAYEDLQGEAK